MEIKAVKFRKDGFYSQLFAFGAEEGPEKYSMDIRYRGSLQNYLIDTGDEVILVDTGLPAALPRRSPTRKSPPIQVRIFAVIWRRSALSAMSPSR